MENGSVNGLLKEVDIKRENTSDIGAHTHLSVSPNTPLVNKWSSPGISKESIRQGFNSKNNTHDPCRLNTMRKIVEPETSSKKQGLKQASKRLVVRSYTDQFRKRVKVSDTPSTGSSDVVIPNGFNKPVERDGDAVYPCSKRQRVYMGSKQHCFRNSEAGVEFHKDTLDKSDKSPIKDQDDVDNAACSECMKGGEILCCGGKECKRGYHLSCVDPPLFNCPPGIWHCIWCVRKKIVDGAHSVSKKIESIWDIRDAIVDKEGKREPEYFVKYQGLAHVHNRWVPETQMLMEAPDLVATFYTRNEDVQWKTDWTVPNRLLRKRLLIFPKNDGEGCNEFDETTLDCCNEWLVKWSGLEYDQATWELDNASFLRSTKALKMIRDYESRQKKTEELQQTSTADEERKSLNNLFEVPSGVSPGLHNCVLSSVKKLREYWQKGQNAVVIDEQERAVKVVSFILSLLGGVRRPFLIISTSTAIPMWEAMFSQLAPSANIVVYRGNGNTRGSIRTYEFYTEKGCILFEVLLSAPGIVVEDFDFLECIAWEAIIVDECQCPTTLRHLKTISMMSTHMKLLVVSGLLKGATDYVNMLSFLDEGLDGMSNHHLEIGSNANIYVLKEKLTQFIAYESTTSSRMFHEYWVPVQLSTLQLEQYCSILISNSMLLRSCSKYDPPDLDDVLVSLRKCCVHPYLADQSLQSFVTKGLPVSTYVDVGIKLSGKLHVLDKMLLEMKSRGLRVLIMFQSLGGSGSYSIGNILDDLVCQRFGIDSFIHISNGSHVPSKKQAALDRFDNEAGRFVLLIENRVCLRSIKRLSVDAVILFDSDSEPRNDIVALEKITFNSQYEQPKIFRLYTSCTIEEKNLILVKEGVTLGKSISRSTLQMLLPWGSSYLFKKLDDFHCCQPLDGEEAFFNELLFEFSGQLSCTRENSNRNCTKILKLERCGVYTTNISLLGESHLVDCNETTISFWKKLLEGRCPQWKLLPGPSQRTRRKVQHLTNFLDKPETVITKKGNKLIKTVDSVARQPKSEDKEKEPAGINITIDPEINNNKVKEGIEPNDAQSSTELSLKSDIYRLCQILHYPEVVKEAAIWLLNYLEKNYDVRWVGDAALHAFQISLCWTAASLSNHKIDHKESLLLAKSHLNYDCEEKDAKRILQIIQKQYERFTEDIERLNRFGNTKVLNNHEALLLSSKIKEEDFNDNPMTSLGDAVSGTQSVSMDDTNLQGNKQLDKTVTLQNNVTTSVPISMPLPDEQYRDKGSQNLESTFEETLCCSRQAAVTMNIEVDTENNIGKTSDEPTVDIELHWNSDLVQKSCGSILPSDSTTPTTDVPIMQRTFQSSGFLRTVSDAGAETDALIVKTEVQSQSAGIAPIVPDEAAEADVLIKQTAFQASDILRPVSDEDMAGVSNAGAEEDVLIVKTKVQSSGVDEVAEADVLIKQTAVQASGILRSVSDEVDMAGVSDAGAEEDALIVKTKVQSSGVPPIVSDEAAKADVLIEQTAVQSSGVLRTVIVSDEVDMAGGPNEVVTSSIVPTRVLDERDAIISETATAIGSLREPEGIVVTSTCGQLPTGTDSSLVQLQACPMESNISPLDQLPLSTCQSSLLNNQVNVHTSMNSQQNQSIEVISSQEVQAPMPRNIEDTNASSMHPLPDSFPLHLPGLRGRRVEEFLNDNFLSTCWDPLQNEMARLQNEKMQASKNHEDKKSLLLSDCSKEMEEIRKKYEMLLQDADTALAKKTRDLDTCFGRVFANKLLAEALLSKHIPLSSAQQDTPPPMNQLQLPFLHPAEPRDFSLAQLPNMLMNSPTAISQPLQQAFHPSATVSTNQARAYPNSITAYSGGRYSNAGLGAPAEPRDRRLVQLPANMLMNSPTSVFQPLQLASDPSVSVLTNQAGGYSNSMTRHRGNRHSCAGLRAAAPSFQPYGNFPYVYTSNQPNIPSPRPNYPN